MFTHRKVAKSWVPLYYFFPPKDHLYTPHYLSSATVSSWAPTHHVILLPKLLLSLSFLVEISWDGNFNHDFLTTQTYIPKYLHPGQQIWNRFRLPTILYEKITCTNFSTPLTLESEKWKVRKVKEGLYYMEEIQFDKVLFYKKGNKDKEKGEWNHWDIVLHILRKLLYFIICQCSILVFLFLNFNHY